MKLSIFNLRGSENGWGASNSPSTRFGLDSTGDKKLGLDINNRNPGVELRTQMLNNLLIAAVFTSGILYLLGLPAMLQDHQWGRIFVYGLIAITIIALNRAEKLVFAWRSAIFLGIIFAGGAFMLATEGLSGNGRLLLLALPILATFLLVDFRFTHLLRFSAWALSLITLVTIGIFTIQGYLSIGEPGENNPNWVSATVGFLMFAFVGMFTFERYIKMQEANHDRQVDLARESELLMSRLTKQTGILTHRLIQIRTAAEINAVASSLQDPKTLFYQVCELVRERFGLYYVGIFLIEPNTNMAVLTSGTGEAGKIMLAEHHQLVVGGDSMIGWATANRKARIALDVGQEAVRFNNPHLPETSI